MKGRFWYRLMITSSAPERSWFSRPWSYREHDVIVFWWTVVFTWNWCRYFHFISLDLFIYFIWFIYVVNACPSRHPNRCQVTDVISGVWSTIAFLKINLIFQINLVKLDRRMRGCERGMYCRVCSMLIQTVSVESTVRRHQLLIKVSIHSNNEAIGSSGNWVSWLP